VVAAAAAADGSAATATAATDTASAAGPPGAQHLHLKWDWGCHVTGLALIPAAAPRGSPDLWVGLSKHTELLPACRAEQRAKVPAAKVRCARAHAWPGGASQPAGSWPLLTSGFAACLLCVRRRRARR
jgi:hypothetical protein